MKNNIRLLILFGFFFILGSMPITTEAAGASMYISPYSGTFFVGDTFNISVFVNTEENIINAVEANLKFDSDLIQVTSPTAGLSFVSIWADQPSYSNKDGTISFKGGVLNPGIKTSAGLVSTISFRVKAPGIANIDFLNSSKILLADGKGTNILKTTASGKYDLVLRPPEGPKISSPTHPSLTAWYKNDNPAFFMEKTGNVTDFSYILDQDPNSIPDNDSEGDNTSVTFNNIGSGILYFHAKAKENNIWGGTSHYPVRIDTILPAALTIRIEKIGFPTSQKFFAYFNAEDSLSGIDHYEVSVANMSNPQASISPFFIETASPYQIPFEKSGEYAVIVRAYDKAGNFAQDTATLQMMGQFFSYTNEGLRIKNFLIPTLLIYLIDACILFLTVFFINKYLKRRNLAKTLKTEVAEAEKEIEDVKKLEKRIQDMKDLEEEAERESKRLAEKLHNQDTNQNA